MKNFVAHCLAWAIKCTVSYYAISYIIFLNWHVPLAQAKGYSIDLMVAASIVHTLMSFAFPRNLKNLY